VTSPAGPWTADVEQAISVVESTADLIQIYKDLCRTEMLHPNDFGDDPKRLKDAARILREALLSHLPREAGEPVAWLVEGYQSDGTPLSERPWRAIVLTVDEAAQAAHDVAGGYVPLYRHPAPQEERP